MILRRLAQHLREQNWTAISIPFGLLAKGVVLGLQVASEYAARSADRGCVLYSQRLRAGLRSKATNCQQLIESHRGVVTRAVRAVDLSMEPWA